MRYLRLVSTTIALLLSLLSVVAQAGLDIIATNVTPACDSIGGSKVTVTLDPMTYSTWNTNELFYHFDGLTGTLAPSGNPTTVQIPASFSAGSSHILWISNRSSATTWDVRSVDYPFVVPNCKKGMTWKQNSTNTVTGTVSVGCAGCNATQGDTLCSTALPLLCIKKSGTGFPLPLPINVNNTSIYYTWSGGIVGTTSATPAPATLALANAKCAAEFGTDWRVAEFHDGWGWNFQAYGGTGNPNQRLWTHINNQPAGVCWQ